MHYVRLKKQITTLNTDILKREIRMCLTNLFKACIMPTSAAGTAGTPAPSRFRGRCPTLTTTAPSLSGSPPSPPPLTRRGGTQQPPPVRSRLPPRRLRPGRCRVAPEPLAGRAAGVPPRRLAGQRPPAAVAHQHGSRRLSASQGPPPPFPSGAAEPAAASFSSSSSRRGCWERRGPPPGGAAAAILRREPGAVSPVEAAGAERLRLDG